MRNPESDEGRELIKAATGDNGVEEKRSQPSVLPWWEAPDVMEEDSELTYATLPKDVTEDQMIGINPPIGTGFKLAYNTVALTYVDD